MNLSTYRAFLRFKFLKTTTVIVCSFAIMGLSTVIQAEDEIEIGEDKLPIIAEAKNRVRGKIISVKANKKDDYPNCHTVKMYSDAGEFVILAIQCGDDK